MPSQTPAAMSTDQRASERVGELIHHAFESLLQTNTDLERLQDLIGLGMDLKQLLAPHSQMTQKFMVPQEQRFRENWKRFILAVEGAGSSTGRPQQAAVETTEVVPTPLPATQERETIPETQSKVEFSPAPLTSYLFSANELMTCCDRMLFILQVKDSYRPPRQHQHQ